MDHRNSGLCAGLMHVLGAATESGRLGALSIYGFSRSTFNQEYVFDGAVAAIRDLHAGITAVVAAIVCIEDCPSALPTDFFPVHAFAASTYGVQAA